MGTRKNLRNIITNVVLNTEHKMRFIVNADNQLIDTLFNKIHQQLRLEPDNIDHDEVYTLLQDLQERYALQDHKEYNLSKYHSKNLSDLINFAGCFGVPLQIITLTKKEQDAVLNHTTQVTNCNILNDITETNSPLFCVSCGDVEWSIPVVGASLRNCVLFMLLESLKLKHIVAINGKEMEDLFNRAMED
jgi:hypothetical protein